MKSNRFHIKPQKRAVRIGLILAVTDPYDRILLKYDKDKIHTLRIL